MCLWGGVGGHGSVQMCRTIWAMESRQFLDLGWPCKTAHHITKFAVRYFPPPLLLHMCRVGQNRIYTPYMTVLLVNSLPKIPYIHRI